MSGVNKVIIIGRLGADVEYKELAGGHSVANMSVATSEKYKDKQGEMVEKTEWHRVTVWGKTADLCQQYLSKGREAYFEGKLQTRKWEDKEGNTRYTTEIVANTVQFLGGAQEAKPSVGDAHLNESPAALGGAERVNHAPSDFGPEPSFDSAEEIPF